MSHSIRQFLLIAAHLAHVAGMYLIPAGLKVDCLVGGNLQQQIYQVADLQSLSDLGAAQVYQAAHQHIHAVDYGVSLFNFIAGLGQFGQLFADK